MGKLLLVRFFLISLQIYKNSQYWSLKSTTIQDFSTEKGQFCGHLQNLSPKISATHLPILYPVPMNGYYSFTVSQFHNFRESENRENRIVVYIENNQAFNYPGGIPTSLVKSHQQWDFSNAWAPVSTIVFFNHLKIKKLFNLIRNPSCKNLW